MSATRPPPGLQHGWVDLLRSRLKAAQADGLEGQKAQLDALLAARWAEAQARLRGAEVLPERWVQAIVDRLGADRPLLEGVAACRTADLFWVCGCLDADATALAALEAAVREEVQAAGGAVRASADTVDQARQDLHALLLVGEQKPALERYAGRGDLRGFLRIAAVRALLRLKGQAGREVGVAADALEALAPAVDPELERLKTRYRDDFSACFREAVAGLEPRDRTLLRLSVLERLSIDRLGALFGVHRATAARWLERVKADLGSRTEELLAERLGLSPPEVESLIRLVRSQVDVSLQGLLSNPPKG